MTTALARPVVSKQLLITSELADSQDPRTRFRWTNMLLESLAAVLPQVQALKELKQYAENLNADAMEDAAAMLVRVPPDYALAQSG